jgi:alkylation response protein AidB-like acyl-CoA dehydrogenase
MYILDEEHHLIRNVVREFAEKKIRPVAQELDEKQQFSVELTKSMGEIGLFGIRVPVEYGGQGLDTLAYIIAVEELARVDSSQAATIMAHNSLGIGPIMHYGTEEQKKKYLPILSTGEALWAFGLTEPEAGSDSRNTKTTAVLKDGKWIINGSKIFITNGASELNIGTTVQAVSSNNNDKKQFSAILVDADASGFKRVPMHGKMMWRASDTAQLFFDDCQVPEKNILGKRDEGSKIMLSTLNSGRIAIAAMAVGLAQGAFEMALKYSQERKQFGKRICDFQAIAFKLADMATKIELGRNIVYKSAWMKSNDLPFEKEAAMAKLFCSEMAKEVVDEGVQIFGGYGLMNDYQIERFYRDVRILQIGEGTSEIQRMVISRFILNT